MKTKQYNFDSSQTDQDAVPKKKKRGYGKFIFSMWFFYLLGVILVGGAFVSISYGSLGKLPTFVQLESPKSALASEVYSSDSTLLGKLFILNRSNATYEELPQHLIDALVATEDIRFYEHSGIDFRGTMRVLFKTILGGQNTGGGSTITQQLAKNLFHDASNSTWERVKEKLKEWIIAIKLERNYTKKEILTMYFNTVPFGYNTFGIKSAARTYFSVPTDSLNIQEAAVLVGMLKASTAYNPKRNPKNSKKRRNVVLSQMSNFTNSPNLTTKITIEMKDSIQALPLELRYKIMDHNAGMAKYFREYIKSEAKKWTKENVKVDGENYNVFRDGLRIYTTINAKMQKYAEEAVAEHMAGLQKDFDKHWNKRDPWEHEPKKIKQPKFWKGMHGTMYRGMQQSDRYKHMKYSQKKSNEAIKKVFERPTKMTIFSWGAPNNEIDTLMTPMDSVRHYKRLLQTGFMVMDPKTGHILAWVGGVDFKHFKYDNASPSAKRQVGSTFKPFVYALAIENGWSPCRRVPNVRVVFPEFNNWSPKNAGRYKAGQMITLKDGLAHSVNNVSAYIMKRVGPQPVVDMAKRMGITSHMDPYPSICLGTPDISVYEMVGAYSTFANKGFHSKPLAITKIEDKNGTILRTFPSAKTEVITEEYAYAMLSLLKGVVDRGTARRLRTRYKLTGDIAGKTGTTNDQSDGWFMGCTPELVAGVWTGGDEKKIRFNSLALGAGGNMALPIWGIFMKKAYADASLGLDPNATFERPKRLGIELDCNEYRRVAPKKPDNFISSERAITPSGGFNGLTDPTITPSRAPGTKPKPAIVPTTPPASSQDDPLDYNNEYN